MARKAKALLGELKMGRRPATDTLASGKSPVVALRFPPDQLQKIDAEAGKHGLGRSAMVRRLVTVGLQFIGKIKSGK